MKPTPTSHYNTIWKKSNLYPFCKIRLLLLEGIGLCGGVHNPSTPEDSEQAEGWSLALFAILQPFYFGYSLKDWFQKLVSNCLGEPKAKKRPPEVSLQELGEKITKEVEDEKRSFD